jgi:hypothetical protein
MWIEDIKVGLKEMDCEKWSGLRAELHHNGSKGTTGSLKCWVFVELLGFYRFLKRDCALW